MAVPESQRESINWTWVRFPELDAEALYSILRLRQQVFIIEQQCIYPDLDNKDQAAIHLCAWQGPTLLAYLRGLPPELHYPEASFGRVVVSPEARGLKLGRELVSRGISCCQQTWPGAGVRIGAQAYLESFYQGFGFQTAGDVYDEDGIPHVTMFLRETP